MFFSVTSIHFNLVVKYQSLVANFRWDFIKKNLLKKKFFEKSELNNYFEKCLNRIATRTISLKKRN